MSTLTQAMSIALSGLQTATSLIAVSSNNISNAQTPGFSSKTANVTAVSYGTEGGGSAISSYGRATNEALSNSYNLATSENSFYSAQNNYLTQIQAILDSTSANPTLSNDIANFSAAWSQYSSNPESAIQQQAVISAGQTLAKDINTIATEIGSLNTQIQSDTQTSVNSLNADLTQIAALNQSIQQASTAGQQTGNLLDQRDQLVNAVASYVSVNVQQRVNGQIALYTPTGQLLVDSGVAEQFSYDGTNIKDLTGVTITNSMVGGAIEAEVNLRDGSASALASTTIGVGTVGKLQAQIGTLVSALVNNGAPTSAFATAYANAATASTAIGASQNGRTVNGNFFTVSYNMSGTPDATSFAVNSAIVGGTSELPQTNAISIANSFNSTANYATSGLTASNVTYAQLGSAILSNYQQAANQISAQSASATSSYNYYKTTLSNATGVNIDTELANLVAYQNSYAAAAHVISTVNAMLTTLISSI